MPRSTAKSAGDEAQPTPELKSEQGATTPEMAAIVGRVKWFDGTRGFGFLVSDDIDGDVLLHFSVLREHGRRSVPEGAVLEVIPVRLERGLQAKKVLSIDLSTALPQHTRSSNSSAERADRKPAIWTRPSCRVFFVRPASSPGSVDENTRSPSLIWQPRHFGDATPAPEFAITVRRTNSMCSRRV